jgi:DNA-binding transcriptional regulator YhcF (GntR family)
VTLDPDDPRPPYQQVASDLRAAILSRRFQPGARLPSGAELARQYGVARMTVQQAIRLLRDDSLVVTRQGSGVFVRAVEPPVGVRHHLSRAFRAEHVSVDYAGISAAALAESLDEAVGQVLAGRTRPRSVAVRVLVPDGDQPWILPVGAPGSPSADVPESRGEAPGGRAPADLAAVAERLEHARQVGLLDRVRTEVRSHPLTPLFTLYVVNGEETFFALHPVARAAVQEGGEPRPVLEVPGEVALLHHRAADPESVDAQAVDQARRWFDSVWETVAHALPAEG